MKYLLTILILIATTCYGFDGIPLSINEPSGVARTNEYVTFGVPFSRTANLYSTSSLGVFSGTTEVEAQFVVTSRWSGSPTDTTAKVRFVLVTFKIPSITASGALTGYTIKSTGSGSETTGVTLTETTDSITVATGTATFVLSKTSFNLFDSVTIGASTIVSSGASVGGKIVDTSTGIDSSAGGKSYTANQGTYLSGSTDSITFTEDATSGALHKVVTVDGHHVNSTGGDTLSWSLKLHFYKDSPNVFVDYSVVDRELPWDIDRYDIDYIGLNTKLNLTAPTVTIAGATGETTTYSATLTSGQELALRQTGTVEQSLTAYSPGAISTLNYAVSGATTATGGRARGWIRSETSSYGMFVSVLDFDRMFPKKNSADYDGNVDIALWPTEDIDCTWYSGAQRTHTIMYSFYTGEITDAASEALDAQNQNPIFVHPSGEYISSTYALGASAPFDTSLYPTDIQTDLGTIFSRINGQADFIIDKRENDSNAGGIHSVGFWAHGSGIPNDGPWAANDYDLVKQYLLAAVMNNTESYAYKWFKIAKETGRHSSDVYINHSFVNNNSGVSTSFNDTAIVRNGNTTRKKYLGRPCYNPAGNSFHEMGNVGYQTVNVSHNQGAEGFSYVYFISGDLTERDVAKNQIYYARHAREQMTFPPSEARTYSTFVNICLGVYSLTGDSDTLNDIDWWLDLMDSYQDYNSGGYDVNGHIWTDSSTTTIGTVPFMNSLAFIALVDSYATLPTTADRKDRIVNAADFTQDEDNNLWNNTTSLFYRDRTQAESYSSYMSSSAGFGFAYYYETDATAQAHYRDIAVRALAAAYTPVKEKDISGLTRGVFPSVFYLQTTVPEMGTVLRRGSPLGGNSGLHNIGTGNSSISF